MIGTIEGGSLSLVQKCARKFICTVGFRLCMKGDGGLWSFTDFL